MLCAALLLPAVAKAAPVSVEGDSGVLLVGAPIPGVDARGAALLMSGQSGGQVGGAVTWTVADSGGPSGGLELRFVVEIDGESLLAGTPPAPVPVEIVAYLVDESGDLIAHVATGVVLAAADDRARLMDGGLKHLGALPAPQGRCSLRLLVRNRVSGRIFLGRRELDLGLNGGGVPVLVPPIVAEPPRRWVKSIQPDLETTRAQEGPGDPRDWPSARPVWRADRGLALIVAGSAVADGLPLAARLEDRLGRTVLEPRIHPEGPVAVDSRIAFVKAEVEAPDLQPGDYHLVLSVDDPRQKRSVDRYLSVLIHEGEGGSCWTDLGGVVDQAEARAAATNPEPSPRDVDFTSMRSAYLDGLRAWANDDVVSARRIISELEGPIAEEKDPRAWRQLVQVEGSVVAELAEVHPGVPMAATLLHREMFLWYLARGEGALAHHSWGWTARLAREVERRAEGRRPDGFAEAVLLDLADRLVESGQPDAARRLFETAAKIAPTSLRPLMALGTLAERQGYPENAIRPLRRLVKFHPEHLEARLRLAVCLLRENKTKEAEEMFRALLSPAVAPWIRALAYQELAGLLIATDRSESAVDLLLEGTGELPDNQRMWILLAHALGADGRPRQASEILAAVNWLATGDGESPRYRYSRWRSSDRGCHARAVLAAAEPVAREALREATS